MRSQGSTRGGGGGCGGVRDSGQLFRRILVHPPRSKAGGRLVKQPQTSVKRGEVGVVVAWSGFMIAHTCGTIHAFVARAMSPATIAMSSHTVKTMIPQHVAIVVVSSLVLVLDLLVSGELQLFFFVSAPCAEVQRRKKITKSNPPPSRMERVQITSCARDFDACVTPFFDFSISKYRSKRKKEAQPSTPCAEQSR